MIWNPGRKVVMWGEWHPKGAGGPGPPGVSPSRNFLDASPKAPCFLMQSFRNLLSPGGVEEGFAAAPGGFWLIRDWSLLLGVTLVGGNQLDRGGILSNEGEG